MREEIKKCLQDVCPLVDFETAIPLVDGGILDSLTIIQIITVLMDTFGIEIDADDIVAENFNSLSSLCEMVERKMK